MNEQNLRPVRSKSEARTRGAAGGKKSGESRRKRKAVRETLETALSMPIESDCILKDIKRSGLPMPAKNPDYLDYVVASVIIRIAKHGSMADLEKLIQILGEESTPQDAALAKVREILDSVPSVIS